MTALALIKLGILMAAGCSVAAVFSSLRLLLGGNDAVPGNVLTENNWESDTSQNIVEGILNAPVGRAAGRKPSWDANHRFPRHGTPEFRRECNWMLSAPPVAQGSDGCTLLTRPEPHSGEGMSLWAAQVVAGRLLALQTGCRLLLDYGPDVHIDQVLGPPLGSQVNWSVPDGFVCRKESRCVKSRYFARSFPTCKPVDIDGVARDLGVEDELSLIPIPEYRLIYMQNKELFEVKNQTSPDSTSRRKALTDAFPRFDIRTGMACAFGSLLELAPTAQQFEPSLFSTLLPALRSEDAFVLSLYIRTGRTDQAYRLEKKGEVIGEDTRGLSGLPQRAIDCALKLETQHLGSDGEGKHYTNVIWMVVTDSPSVKRRITTEYDGMLTKNMTGMPRRVLSTSSRGVHTRPRRGPSTADFAEGMIDWYLLGESDLVISSGGVSFSATGALRTARPVYGVPLKGEECGLLNLNED
mmetsp:Transcript_39493/g.118552  ORF Transcript_39493/g.118552 Transcript_39493/m.118552 type:complete len:467 (-) Transcript_39493:282-1682(-)|eukprot:CAMPEP_0113527546 /NCGR_PEP_ID=MMETSP0015_2-20120614/1354_1 /TAXON_ID=2838 /ORGANISM="Odontella" /LENGTH=466 /DNA_ID=CAMNT_0000425989 /DNA_START=100 /DNA_END=1500 /DNA_ORIENTATION=- /assembly_acc=CAM_ASM_000160